MSDQGIRSRPRYAPLRYSPVARATLLVCDTADVPGDAIDAGNAIDRYDAVWTVAGHSSAIPSPVDGVRTHAFRATSHLLIALRHHLARQHMGFRLHGIGTEPFLWAVAGHAEAAGLSIDEYQLFAAGTTARRIFCVHCRTISRSVKTSLVACEGCGATLFARDHFSRRLNAFMGVQVDAESPGDVPAVEELYS